MPGNVANAIAATVMPWALCRAFTRSQTWPVQVNEYVDGRRQVRKLAENSRKAWILGQRLSAAQLVTLRNFFMARKGVTEAFYFYDVYETSPLFTYDAGGAALTGRYKVRFEGEFGSTWSMLRHDVSLQLIEVA